MIAVRAALLLAALVVASGSAEAQPRCPGGRALDGSCVAEALSDRARTRSNLMVQRRISVTHQLTLPRADRDFLTAGSREYLR